MVGLKVLKKKLSKYVRLASGGETVLITNRGTVVAEPASPRPDRSALGFADQLMAIPTDDGDFDQLGGDLRDAER